MKLPKSEKGFALAIILVLVFIGSVSAYFLVRTANKNLSIFQKSSLSQSPTPPKQSLDTNSLFGIMIAYNLNDAAKNVPGMLDTLVKKGWTEFRKDDPAYQNLVNNLKKLIPGRTKLVKETGFPFDRGSFSYFTWNVIEPQKEQFDWGLTDTYAKGASDAGVKISAVIQPFTGWDQKNTPVNPNCKMIDAAYYDYKAGPPNDINEYENFLKKTVERYKDNVAVWEIGNENDAPCGGYQDNPQGYLDLVKITSETIKKVDPSAKVVNGGASGHSDNNSERSFWTKFFQLGGGQYIDYFNLHYNTERSTNPKSNPIALQETLTFFNNLMDKDNSKKPLYLTEFGIYSGSPSSQPTGGSQPGQGPSQTQTNLSTQPTSAGQSPIQPLNGKCGDGICDDFEKQNSNACPQDCKTNNHQPTQPPQPEKLTPNQSLPNQTPASQTALYFKDSILAFANGAKMVFIDLIGSGNDIVGSSMAFDTNDQPRLFLTTLKTINQKLTGFSQVEKIADGQYKFTVGGKTIYALWSGTLPGEISGSLKVTDIKGQERIMDAAGIKLNANQPVFVERQE